MIFPACPSRSYHSSRHGSHRRHAQQQRRRANEERESKARAARVLEEQLQETQEATIAREERDLIIQSSNSDVLPSALGYGPQIFNNYARKVKEIYFGEQNQR